MVTLKQACELVLAVRPNHYIHCVNEFKDAFFVHTVPNGVDPNSFGTGLCADIVDKRTGKYEFSNLCDDRLQGDYKQYTRKELERLL